MGERQGHNGTYASAAGRVGGTAMGASGGYFGSTIYTHGSNRNAWVVGFGILRTGKNTGNNFCELVFYRDNGGSPVEQLRVILRDSSASNYEDTQIEVFNGTTTWTVPRKFASGRWYYVEFVCDFQAGVAGSFEVWVNGVQEHTMSGINTAASGSAGVYRFDQNFRQGFWYDDLYIVSDEAGGPTTRLGEIVTEGLLPNGDGAETAWDPSTPGSLYLMVDDTFALTSHGADRISADASALKALFTYTDISRLSGDPTFVGIQVNGFASMESSGTRDLQVRFRDTGGGTANGASHGFIGSTPVYFAQVWHQNPVLASAFTEAGINAMQVGIETVT